MSFAAVTVPFPVMGARSMAWHPVTDRCPGRVLEFYFHEKKAFALPGSISLRIEFEIGIQLEENIKM